MCSSVSRDQTPSKASFGFWLVLILVFKALIQLDLWRRGFLSVSADEFARGIRAARWAADPHVESVQEFLWVWLPFERYLNGSLLYFWNDGIVVPRITVFVASCVLLVTFCFLVYRMFRSLCSAIVASIYLTVQPWFAWLSGTPMLEIYYLASFFLGLYFLVRWLEDRSRLCWVSAGICFAVSTGFHTPSWILVGLTFLLTSLPGVFFKDRWEPGKLLMCGLLSASFVLLYVSIEYFARGTLFAFLSEHTTYSKWYYKGYAIAWSSKLAYYPKLVYEQTPLLAWPFAALGIAFAPRQQRLWRLPLALLFSSLFVFSAMNVFSVPATAAPGRYSLPFTILLAPFVAQGACWWVNFARDRLGRVPGVLAVIVLVGLGAWGLAKSHEKLVRFPRGMQADAVAMGRYLNDLLDAPDFEGHTFLVQLRYWDSIGLQLAAGHFDALVFDRRYDKTNRKLPSLLLKGREEVLQEFRTQKVRYVVLHDPILQAKAEELGGLVPIHRIGSWIVYRRQDEPG